jgi:hypothetical protein
MNKVDYKWLETELLSVTSKSFFRREPCSKKDLDLLRACNAPPQFIEFLEQFGNCWLFRGNDGQYELRIWFCGINSIGLGNCASRIHRGYFKKLKSDVYEDQVWHYSDSGKEIIVAQNFSSWLASEYATEKRRYSQKRWDKLRVTSPCKNDEECRKIAERKLWKVKLLEPKGDEVGLLVENNSTMQFDYISVRFIYDSIDIYLPVCTYDIKPGTAKAVYQKLYSWNPSNITIKPFDLYPEDRPWAYELGADA